jgi:hypothetical protein
MITLLKILTAKGLEVEVSNAKDLKIANSECKKFCVNAYEASY